MSDAGVPLLDLKAQYEPIKAEISEAIDRVCSSQMFILGPEVQGMEKEIAAYCGAKECVGVTSGSDALLIALMALDIGPGDEVITSAYSFFATAGTIARLGATPVFVDIDPVTFNIDPDQIEAKINRNTKAIIPVHLFGQCAEMDPIMDIANFHNIPVVEDAAQAIGSEYKSRRAGSIGEMGCFSFFPSKNLGAFGDAGAVTTNDSALAEKLRCLRMHGMSPKYYHKMIGGNFRIDALQAAILRVKLQYLDQWTAGRQRNAFQYTKSLRERGVAPGSLTVPEVIQNRHIFNQYVVRTDERDAFMDHVKSKKIGCEVYYPVSLHMQECFAYLGHSAGDFPESERAAATSIAIPIYPELTMSQREQVVDAMASFFAVAAVPQRRAA